MSDGESTGAEVFLHKEEDEPAKPAEDAESQRRWPLRASAAAAAVIAVAAVAHGLGAKGAAIAGAVALTAVLAGLILWRLPHLRRHFARPRGSWRSPRPQNSPFRPQRRPGLHLPGLGDRRNGLGRALPGSTGRAAAGRRLFAARAARRDAPGPARPGLPGQAPRRGIRSRLPSWVPGSRRQPGTRRRVQAGAGALKPGASGRTSTGRRKGTGTGTPGRTPAGASTRRKRASRKRGGKGGPQDKKAAAARAAERPGPEKGNAVPASAVPGKTAEPERQPGTAITPAGDKPAGRPRQEAGKMSAAQEAADAVEQHLGRYEPESGTDLDHFLRHLPGFYEAAGSAMARLAQRLGDEFPVHPAVREHLHEMAATTAGLAEFAHEAYQIHRTAHEKELERIEQPRPQEEIWDVQSQ